MLYVGYWSDPARTQSLHASQNTIPHQENIIFRLHNNMKAISDKIGIRRSGIAGQPDMGRCFAESARDSTALFLLINH
jgi:hypothetical protein